MSHSAIPSIVSYTLADFDCAGDFLFEREMCIHFYTKFLGSQIGMDTLPVGGGEKGYYGSVSFGKR
jgi:hypothetical protein